MRLNSITFDMLNEAAQNFAEANLRSYSGRGMYGKNCVGIVGGHETLGYLIEGVMIRAANADINSHDLANDVGQLIRNMQSDSMGCDVIYYWPGMEWPEGVEGYSEDEE